MQFCFLAFFFVGFCVDFGVFLLWKRANGECDFCCRDMENEGIAQKSNKSGETDFVLQWGNRKRMRYMKVKEPERVTSKPDCLGKKKVSSNANGDRRVVSAEKASSTPQNYRLNK